MVDLIIYAIPAFVLLLIVELLSFRYARDEDLVGYESRDTRASLSMGGGNVVINAVWKLAVVFVYAGLYELTPLRMPADEWDLPAALPRRRSRLLLVPPGPPRGTGLLGQPRRPPLLPALQPLDRAAADLDADDALPAPIEYVFNTPSHRRVHHGANEVYLDRNYGGILIVWDRIFGSFQGETERPRYGLTQNIRSFRPTRVAFHEFVDLARDVRGADNWRDRFGYSSAGPAGHPTEAAAAPGGEMRPGG